MKHLAAEPVGRPFRYQLVVGVLIGALLGAILGAYLMLPAIEQGMAASVASVVMGLAYGGVFGVLLAAAPILGAALLLSFVEKRRPGSSGWRQARLSAMGAGLGGGPAGTVLGRRSPDGERRGLAVAGCRDVCCLEHARGGGGHLRNPEIPAAT